MKRVAAVWICSIVMFSFIVLTVDISQPVRGATTIYVDDDGGADYQTINEALFVALDGDTIYVYSGTYYENLDVHNSITLIGENYETTIINGSGNGIVITIFESYVNLSGFTIMGSGSEEGDAGLAITIFSENCDISSNKFEKNADGIRLFSNNNTFMNNNISSNDDDGFYLTSSHGNLIQGNKFWANNNTGLYLSSSNANMVSNNYFINNSFGISTWEAIGNELNENTIISNPEAGMAIQSNSEANNLTGNIVYNNGFGITLVLSNGNNITDNDVSYNLEIGINLQTSFWNNIDNNTCSLNGDDGFHLQGSNENYFTNNIAMFNDDGLVLTGSDDNRILFNNYSSNNDRGIDLFDSHGNNISWNKASSNTEDGIHIISSSDVSITNNEFRTNNYGVFLSLSSSNRIYHNNIIDNNNQASDNGNNQWDDGYPSGGNFWSDWTSPDDYSGPDQDEPGSDGIVDEPKVLASPTGRDDYPFTTKDGWISLPGPVYNIDSNEYFDTIQGAIDDANTLDGHTIEVSAGTYYENVTVNKAINLIGEDRENTIINESGSEDVILITADGVTISNFTLIGSGLNESDAGIELKDNQNCNINNNIIFNSFQGINVNNSNNNLISNNNISFNGFGISFNLSIGNNVMDNVMIEDGIFIGGDSIEHWNSHEIDTSNTVNGKPVYYWKNENSGTIPANGGQVILANCRNIVIENQELTNTSVGIELGFSRDNVIRDNTVSFNNILGLFMISSNKNTISHNIISGNGISVSLIDSMENNIHDNHILDSAMGILVTVSEGNTIKANNISDNDNGILIIASNRNIIEGNIISNKEYGIWLIFSNESSIRANIITQHFYGIYIFVSDRNNISENIISNNIMGIYFWITGNWNNITLNLISNNSIGIIIMGFIFVNPENNSIYHNSFINNTNQSFDTSINGNKWDNGYPSGGNYWDDYTGIDTKSGPDQDISGYDGIGDTPYEMDSGTIDNYPLIKPLGEDFVPPSIDLISPSNNAVINPGIIIDFSISDSNLYKIMYSINEEPYQDLLAPYDLDTNYWEDGNYHIGIQAEDTSKNTNTASFNFIVDSTPPTISLNSPIEGSFIGSSPEISLTISDENLDEVLYSINSGNQLQLYDPYTIDGSGWPDGEITLTIYASDKAGNSKEKSFLFRKDNIFPQITLMSPFNESILMEFSTLDFDVSDGNLDSVSYSLDQGPFQTFEDPYDLDISGWDDGEYKITIKAEDTAGNVIEKWYIFRKDTTPPSIDSSSINDNDVDIEVDSQIIIEFSEPMDTESVESAISISPFTEYSSSWSTDNKTLTITCNDLMDYETLYQVSISTKAKDLANRGLEDAFEIEFTTQARSTGSDEGEFPFLFLLLTLLAVIIIVILILVMTLSKKKKAPVSGVDSELLSGVGQVSQTIQFNCFNCNNLIQVNDTGVTQNVSCPYCSTTLSVPSQIAAAPAIASQPTAQTQIQPQSQPQATTQPQFQAQQPMLQIACPNCLHKFSVVRTGSPFKVQCPNCGTSGTMR